MPLSPCHQRAKDLFDAIQARALGTQAQSVGHKGRNVQFSEMSTNHLISLYNQSRNLCADALADPDLIPLSPLDAPGTTRGRPLGYAARGRV